MERIDSAIGRIEEMALVPDAMFGMLRQLYDLRDEIMDDGFSESLLVDILLQEVDLLLQMKTQHVQMSPLMRVRKFLRRLCCLR